MKLRRWLGAAVWLVFLLVIYRFLFAGQVWAGRDLFRLFIPESAVLRERLLNGELPLWISGERLGQPFLALLYTQVLYPPRVLCVLAFGPVWGVNVMLPLHAAIASWGAYLAARRLGATGPSAWLALAFGLTPFFTRLHQSLHVVCALAWSGWILAAALELSRRRDARAVAKLALFIALAALSGMPESLLWQLPIAFTAVIARSIPSSAGGGGWPKAGRGVTPRAAVLALSAIALGLLAVSIVYLPAAELWREWRAPAELRPEPLDWSVSWPQLISTAGIYADRPLSPDYWGGDQQFVTSLFIGAVPCLLAWFLSRRTRLLAALGLLSIVFSLGAHFPPAGWLIHHTPLGLFRFPVKHLFAWLFLAPVLAAAGAHRLTAWRRKRRIAMSRWLIAVAATFIAGAVGVAVTRDARAGLAAGLTWLTFVALALLIAVRLARPRRLPVAIAVLALVELAFAHLRIPNLQTISPSQLEQPSQLAANLRELQAQRLSIVLEGDVPPSGDPEAAARESVRYVERSRENLVPLRYLEEHLDAVEGYGFREPWPLTEALSKPSLGIYRTLGVTHFLRSSGQPQPFEHLTELEGTADVQLYSTYSLPRAWIVQSAIAADGKRALEVLRDPAEATRVVALDRDVSGTPCASKIYPVRREEEELEFDIDACADGFLVMSDAYFPGWVARVDGQKVKVERADHLLRAVQLQKGHRKVLLSYQPKSVEIGLGLSVMAVGVMMRLGFGFKKRPKLR